MPLSFQEAKPYCILGIEEDEAPLGWDLVPNPWNCEGKTILSSIVGFSIYAINSSALSLVCR
jgi:hypothetical protein